MSNPFIAVDKPIVPLTNNDIIVDYSQQTVEKRRGRPPGSRNKSTSEDLNLFARNLPNILDLNEEKFLLEFTRFEKILRNNINIIADNSNLETLRYIGVYLMSYGSLLIEDSPYKGKDKKIAIEVANTFLWKLVYNILETNSS